MPDATGLELVAHDLRELDESGVLGTLHHRGQAFVLVEAGGVHRFLEHLKGRGYRFLASLHAVDYFPEEPRLGVHYCLLDMEKVDRITVKTRVHTEDPVVPSVVDLFPTADHQEREAWDMFGIVFEGHPDLRRILMPEDYEGHPQRRDFPIGGEQVLFTHNEPHVPGWWQ